MNKTLGEMVAELRRSKGLTQARLAEQLGVTDRAVSKWERGLSCPDIALLPKLAQVLEVTVDQLMQSAQPAREAEKPARSILALVLRAVPLAMGVAVTVLSVLGQLDAVSGLGMLGLGLACLALDALGRPRG